MVSFCEVDAMGSLAGNELDLLRKLFRSKGDRWGEIEMILVSLMGARTPQRFDSAAYVETVASVAEEKIDALMLLTRSELQEVMAAKAVDPFLWEVLERVYGQVLVNAIHPKVVMNLDACLRNFFGEVFKHDPEVIAKNLRAVCLYTIGFALAERPMVEYDTCKMLLGLQVYARTVGFLRQSPATVVAVS